MIRHTMLLVLLVVCSALSAAAEGPAALDACSLMLKADVDAAFAPRVFREGKITPGGFTGTAKLATVASCTFTSRGASLRDMLTVGILARRAPSDQYGITVAAAKDGASKLNMAPVDVRGLGDAAYWVIMDNSGQPIVQLNVFKGKRLWLMFSTSTVGLSTETALANLTTLAKETLARL